MYEDGRPTVPARGTVARLDEDAFLDHIHIVGSGRYMDRELYRALLKPTGPDSVRGHIRAVGGSKPGADILRAREPMDSDPPSVGFFLASRAAT